MIALALALLLQTSAPTSSPVVVGSQPTTQESRADSAPKKSTQPAAPIREASPSSDDRIAKYTLWLTWFTGVLAFATIGLWLTTRRTLKHLEQEFLAANRPRLVMRQIGYTPEGADAAKVEYTLANVGQSRARIVESNITSWTIAKGAEWPGRPPYGPTKDAIGTLTIEAGKDHVGIYQDAADEVGLLIGDIAKDHLDTMLLGYVTYLDDNGIERRVGFCRKRSEGGGRFVPTEDPDYEYFY